MKIIDKKNKPQILINCHSNHKLDDFFIFLIERLYLHWRAIFCILLIVLA